MNKLKKIFCLVLSFAMILVIVASCNKRPDPDKDKFVVATYDKGYVYSDDITQWVNYLYVFEYEDIQNGSKTKQDIAKEAIETYLLNIFLDEELKKYDLNISNDDLEMLVSNQILELDENFDSTDSSTGENYKGYEGWKKAYSVDDKFIYDLVKFLQQEQLMGVYLASNASITDEDLKEYYSTHAINYAQDAGYVFNFALVEVKDLQNEEELEEAKNIAQTYIDKLKSNSITFDEVVEEVKAKYTLANGYSGMSANITMTGDFVADTTFERYVQINDLEAYLEAVNEHYKDIMDPSASKDSKEYENYLKYRFELYQAKAFYTLKQRIVGVYSEPIEYPDGFVIFEYVKHQSSGWGNFEELKEKIKSDYIDANIVRELNDFETKLLDTHELELADFTVE